MKEQSNLPESPTSKHVYRFYCFFHCIFSGHFLQFYQKERKKKSHSVLEPHPSQLLRSESTLDLLLLEDEGAYFIPELPEIFLKLFLPWAGTGLGRGVAFHCPLVICFFDTHEGWQRSSSPTSLRKQY